MSNKSKKQPLDLELVPKEQFTVNQESLLVLADATVKAGTQFANKFREMVAFIREKEMLPNEVNPVLTKAGFPASRASEIKAIAFSADEVWNTYKEAKLGFRATLEKARETNATGKKDKRGRKRKSKDALFAAIAKAHAVAAKKEQTVTGSHYAGRSVCLVFPLIPGTKTYGDHLWKISVTVEPQAPTPSGAAKE